MDEAFARLIRLCESKDPLEQIEGLEFLGKLLPPAELSEALISLLESPDAWVRNYTLIDLRVFVDGMRQRIGECLHYQIPAKELDFQSSLYEQEGGALLRHDTVETLEVLGYGRAVREVEWLLLNDPDWAVRCRAARYLGYYGNRLSLPSLLAALDDEYVPVVRYAAIAIGQVGDSIHLAELERRLHTTEDDELRLALMAARYSLGGTPYLGEFLETSSKVASGKETLLVLSALDVVIRECPPMTLLDDASIIHRFLDDFALTSKRAADEARSIQRALDRAARQ